MRAIGETARALLWEIALGAWLGLWILGAGGRVAMRLVAHALDQSPAWTVGGTLAVVAMGAVAGAAGAAFYAVSRAAARLVGQGARARTLQLALFGTLLVLVTLRGLSGSPGPTASFWLLVAAYGVALDRVMVRRARRETDAPTAASLAT